MHIFASPDKCQLNSVAYPTQSLNSPWTDGADMCPIMGKDRDPLIRDPQIVSLLSLIEAILSLIDSYISLLSLIKAIFQRVSKWGSLSFPMICGIIHLYVVLYMPYMYMVLYTMCCTIYYVLYTMRYVLYAVWGGVDFA
mgnify:CR=1 FL=1